MPNIADKARRAAEWWNENWTRECIYNDVTGIATLDFWDSVAYVSGSALVTLAERCGWQDTELDIPTEEEAPDLCAQAMGQFADEVDPTPFQLTDGDQSPDAGNMVDGLEWYATEEYAACNECELGVILTGNGFKWQAFPVEESDRKPVSGTAPTREEARRRAVKAARALGKEGE